MYSSPLEEVIVDIKAGIKKKCLWQSNWQKYHYFVQNWGSFYYATFREINVF